MFNKTSRGAQYDAPRLLDLWLMNGSSSCFIFTEMVNSANKPQSHTPLRTHAYCDDARIRINHQMESGSVWPNLLGFMGLGWHRGVTFFRPIYTDFLISCILTTQTQTHLALLLTRLYVLPILYIAVPYSGRQAYSGVRSI